MKTNIYVIYGGKSPEHEVSLITGFSVINALDKEKYNVYPVYITKEGHWCCLELQESNIEDVKHLQKDSCTTVCNSMGKFLTDDFKEHEESIIFPALHGTNGEDGTLQGFLELLEVPYVGNTVLASAVGIDKVIMKELFSKYNIPQAKYTYFNYHHWAKNPESICGQVEEIIGYPCYVKPARMGSSVGINRCESLIELKTAIEESLLYDSKIIIEEEILGREMQIAVIGNDEPKCSVVGEYIQVKKFMDYEAKYVDGQLIPVIPAVLLPHTREKMLSSAKEAFQLLNCAGLLRVDYFVTDKDEFYVNEVNTMPGFTSFSMFPALWEKTDGTTYGQLIEKLIELAFEKYQQKKRILKERKK